MNTLNTCEKCRFWEVNGSMPQYGKCSQLMAVPGYINMMLVADRSKPVSADMKYSVCTVRDFGCTKFEAKDGQ